MNRGAQIGREEREAVRSPLRRARRISRSALALSSRTQARFRARIPPGEFVPLGAPRGQINARRWTRAGRSWRGSRSRDKVGKCWEVEGGLRESVRGVMRMERRRRALLLCGVWRAGVQDRVRWPLRSGAARGRRGYAARHPWREARGRVTQDALPTARASGACQRRRRRTSAMQSAVTVPLEDIGQHPHVRLRERQRRGATIFRHTPRPARGARLARAQRCRSSFSPKLPSYHRLPSK